MEVFIDDESKLTLHGLQQHYVKLSEDQKNRKLNDLLDALEFNQVSALNMLSNFNEHLSASSWSLKNAFVVGHHFREEH